MWIAAAGMVAVITSVVVAACAGLVLEADGGRVLLPGRVFHDEAIVLLGPERSDG